ncbi:nitrilase-related carbon-nitrogen hydrolase [Nocardia bovistercoris]|uniref:nitrilase-related carbon-nitrogen hydrolase n=1 Tax=Nocardia bovistercoris TaxID=2785916 RepID=UPI001E44E6DC|nr:nitrilase-related carbon-nitrogen hydrolase [Nocardia bovistercoris]
MRIAAAQARPVWLDPTAGTATVVDWLTRAAAADVDLVAFPETFLSGYPVWLARTGGARFDNPDQKAAYAYYLDAAVTLDGPHLATIRAAVADLGVFCYLGITERVRGTVYCTLVAIDPTRGLVGAHRKLVPTHEERLVWGMGDGNGLRTHPVGEFRASGLSCWENWMPQARHALYADGATLHVSTWPGSVRNTRDITRFIAMEGRLYALAVGAVLDYADLPADFHCVTPCSRSANPAATTAAPPSRPPTARGSSSPSSARNDSSSPTSTRPWSPGSARTSTPPATTPAPTSSPSPSTEPAAPRRPSWTNNPAG